MNEYSGEYRGFDSRYPNEEDKLKVANYLKDYKIVIAYESVGDFGCDSCSYFLIQNKETKKYEEFSGSHCSCYGFEGQFDPQETTLEYLKSDRFRFYCGGYDNNSNQNQIAVKNFLEALDEE